MGLGVAALLASCSSDYLDKEPITSISDVTAVATTGAAQMTVYGICRIMNTQMSSGTPRANTGEASYVTYINEGLSPDNCSYFNMGEFGINWNKWDLLTNENAAANQTMWNYLYMIVARANTLLATIEEAEGPDAEKQWIEAQARTFRAFAYTRLVSWYGPRWQDSNNGAAYAVVLRTEPGSEPTPVATMNEVMNLIYSDLDAAIQLYGTCGKKRQYDYEPDLNVAYGVYARAAMIKNDWAKAQTMAHNARAAFPVMSNDDFMSGFIYAADDYMWTTPPNDIYYSSFGSWFSCNGYYPCAWSRGYAISADLYRQLDPNDIRRNVFFMPDRAQQIAALPGFAKVSAVTEADFWNGDNVTPATINTAFAGSALMDMATGFVELAMQQNPVSDYVVQKPYCRIVDGEMESVPSSMQVGASVKMWSTGNNKGFYADSDFPWMRATEFVLTEAEAAYMAGDMATAKSVITELNGLRIPGYVAPDGEALLNDIRVSRRVELFQEGHAWADFKRWNVPVERRAWVEGDVTSGNSPASYTFSHATSDCNGWRLTIPKSESDFNPAFDRTLMNYGK